LAPEEEETTVLLGGVETADGGWWWLPGERGVGEEIFFWVFRVRV